VSDASLERFFAAEPAEATRVAREIFIAGGAERLAERLLHELTSDSTWAREQAVERLCALTDHEPLLEPLSASLADEADAERRNAARSALAVLAGPRAQAPAAALRLLRELLHQSSDADVRLLAASALGESENPAARPALEQALSDPEPNVISAAADALGILGDTRAVPALSELAREGDFWTRVSAVVSLGRLRDPAAIPTLTAALAEPWLASPAVGALGEIGDPSALEALRPVLEGQGSAREEALGAISSIFSSHPDTPVPEWLRGAIRESEEELERRLTEHDDADAARLLGLGGSARAAATLVRALGIPGREDSVAAGLALLPREVAVEAITGRLEADEDGTRVLLLGALPPLDSREAVEVVARQLSVADPEVRAAAAEVLGRTGEELVLPALERSLGEPAAQHGVALAYSRLGLASCQPLMGLLRSESPPVRAAAAEGLARCGGAYVGELRAAVRSEADAETRYAIVRSLGASRTAEAVEELIPLLESEDPGIRFAAVQALGRARRPEAFEPLVAALGDEREEIRAGVLAALGEIGDPRADRPLADHLSVPGRDLRRTAIFALDRMAHPRVVEQLLQALRDPDREVRLTAVRVLHRLRAAEGRIALEQVAELDPEALVRQAAGHALADIGSAPPSERG
jgi:HEAT repeat protein